MSVDEALATSCVSIWRYYCIQLYTGHTPYRVYSDTLYRVYSDTLYRVYSDTLYRIYSDTLYTGYTVIHYIQGALYRVSNDESIVFFLKSCFLFEFFQMNIFNLDELYIIWNYYTIPMQQTSRSSFLTT